MISNPREGTSKWKALVQDPEKVRTSEEKVHKMDEKTSINLAEKLSKEFEILKMNKIDMLEIK